MWKPIETAPTNGEPVLLYLDPPLNTSYCVGWSPVSELSVVVGWGTPSHYKDGGQRWNCGFCDEGSADTEGYSTPYQIDVTPTHWAPLPERP